MNSRKYHRIAGIIMLAPLFAWALTGLVFLIQPGYGDAYAMLAPRSYPVDQPIILPAQSEWLEFRVLKTVLGEHVLARDDQGWAQLNPHTLLKRTEPNDADVLALVSDAISVNPDRYGSVLEFSDGTALTSTGVSISLDWDRLSLQQYGKDTLWIDRFYNIHYLQWTGVALFDRVLGVLGLLLLAGLSVTGFSLALVRR